MAKLTIVNEAEVESTGDSGGTFTTSSSLVAKQLSPLGYSINMSMIEFPDGGDLAWSGEHPEEGVYVIAGGLTIDGRDCPPGGAVIVESDVNTNVFLRAGSKIAYCAVNAKPDGWGAYGAPNADGHSVHIVGPRGWFQSGGASGIGAVWFSDSTCPTCRISLFVVYHEGKAGGPRHSHSQDEIIYVLEGSVALGPREYGQGTCLSIPADTSYRVAFPNGGKFLNFRADVSEHTVKRDEEPVLESALIRGGQLVGDFR